MDWRPIETAPKDETWVLLYFPGGDETKCKTGFWSEGSVDWYGSESDSHSMTDFFDQPTHWMPLPEPPKP
jgi:hypothetical protein